MSYTTTTNKSLYEVTPGTEIGTWGPIINGDWTYVDAAFGGYAAYTLTSTMTNQVVGTTGTTTTPPDYVNLRIILNGNTGSSYVFTGSGSISGTVLTISGVTGTISAGNVISGSGVSSGTKIVNQISGTTGGAGTYTVDNSQTVSTTTINGNNGTINLTFPSGVAGMWIVNNATTGPASIFAVTAAGGSGVYLNQGVNSIIYSDGTNVYFADSRYNTNAIGATGGGSDQIFFENGQVITTSYTIPSNVNAMTAGPVTINSGITVTINTPTVWTIV